MEKQTPAMGSGDGAADGIVGLAKHAKSEAVRLAALRAIMADMRSVSYSILPAARCDSRRCHSSCPPAPVTIPPQSLSQEVTHGRPGSLLSKSVFALA
jgi:hypothetical protein